MPDTAASGRDFFTIDARTTALLVVDMQNSFVAEGARFSSAGARELIPRLEQLIAFAREHRLPVVWTQSDHSAPYGGLLLRKFPVIRDERELWQGTPSFDLYPGITQPRPDEFRVVKHKYDAFFETDLDAILRNIGVDTIIVTGTATNVCCESTARSAFSRDYKVVFPSDCNATTDDELQQASLRTIDGFFGRVMTAEALVEELLESLLSAGGTIRAS